MEHYEVDVENEDDYEDGDGDEEYNNEDGEMGVDSVDSHDVGDRDKKHDNEDDEHLLQDLLDSDPGEVWELPALGSWAHRGYNQRV